MLAALRSNDRLKLAQFEDIQPVEIEPYFQAARSQLQNTTVSLRGHRNQHTTCATKDLVVYPAYTHRVTVRLRPGPGQTRFYL